MPFMAMNRTGNSFLRPTRLWNHLTIAWIQHLNTHTNNIQLKAAGNILRMTLKSEILSGLLGLMLLLIALIIYILQRAGKEHVFQQWPYQPGATGPAGYT